MPYTIEDLDEHIEELQEKKKRLGAGEEFCKYSFYKPAREYDCYCTGCDKRLLEVRSKFDIPFKKDAYCRSCSMTPEQKEEERVKKEIEQYHKEAMDIRDDLAMLAKLKEMYPNEL